MARFLPWRIAVPLAVGVAVSLTILGLSEVAYKRLDATHSRMSAALQAQAQLTELFAAVVDAETGQRGFLLTRRDEYLVPYKEALPRIDEARLRLQELIVQFGDQRVRTQSDRLFQLVGKRLAELEAMLKLDQEAGRAAALNLLRTNLGKEAMDDLRAATATLSFELTVRMVEGREQWQSDLGKARAGMRMMSGVAVVLLVIVMVLAWRELRQREARAADAVQEQRRLEALVDERTAELTELSNYLQSSREEEKSRLARELHDELGGILVAAKLDVARVREQFGAEAQDSARRLDSAMTLLDDAVAIKRRIIEELRPTLLDNLGMSVALNWLADDVCKRAGLTFELNIAGDEDLPATISLALFRIVQEALTNVVRHAQANSVSIEILRDARGVTLLLSDDGIGVDEGAVHSALSHGILGMRHRVRALGGEFSIRGRPGKGTTIEVHLPLGASDATPP
jgi:signal transduction histidine kinase